MLGAGVLLWKHGQDPTASSLLSSGEMDSDEATAWSGHDQPQCVLEGRQGGVSREDKDSQGAPRGRGVGLLAEDELASDGGSHLDTSGGGQHVQRPRVGRRPV